MRDIASWEQPGCETAPADFWCQTKVESPVAKSSGAIFFSPASPLKAKISNPASAFCAEYPQHVGVDDPYQRDYYLKEFDLLVERN